MALVLLHGHSSRIGRADADTAPSLPWRGAQNNGRKPWRATTIGHLLPLRTIFFRRVAIPLGGALFVLQGVFSGGIVYAKGSLR